MGKGKTNRPEYRHAFYNSVVGNYFIFLGVTYGDAYEQLEVFCDKNDSNLEGTNRIGMIDPDDFAYIGTITEITDNLLPKI